VLETVAARRRDCPIPRRARRTPPGALPAPGAPAARSRAGVARARTPRWSARRGVSDSRSWRALRRCAPARGAPCAWPRLRRARALRPGGAAGRRGGGAAGRRGGGAAGRRGGGAALPHARRHDAWAPARRRADALGAPRGHRRSTARLALPRTRCCLSGPPQNRNRQRAAGRRACSWWGPALRARSPLRIPPRPDTERRKHRCCSQSAGSDCFQHRCCSPMLLTDAARKALVLIVFVLRCRGAGDAPAADRERCRPPPGRGAWQHAPLARCALPRRCILSSHPFL
jgi:hypothetical protein